ncbi:MAG: Tyrocidine synthase 3 [Firmicutes bacterium ADurb.Bin419]|nr:MAG: Tyrocidine synthase 3 [Firmicutes bacterium ADurb.Bin419]
MKFIQSYQANGFVDEALIIPDLENTITWIIENRLKLKLNIENANTQGMHEYIQHQIDNGIPVMVTVNLKKLYYSQYYMQQEWPYLLLINGYDCDKKVYYIVDSTHTELSGEKEGQNYSQFIITYDMLETLYKSYENVMDRAYIASIQLEDGVERNHNEMLKEFVEFFISERSKEPYREKAFVNEILNKIEKGIEVKRSSIFEPTTKIDFIFTRTISYKEFLYDIFSSFIFGNTENQNLKEEFGFLKKELLSNWRKVLNTSILGLNLKRSFDLSQLINKSIEIEEKIRQLSRSFLDELKETGSLNFASKETDNLESSAKTDRSPKKKEYVEPVTDIEKKLCEIWKQLFNIDKIGLLDNFFDLGGHSLIGARLSAIVIKEFNLELPVDIYFSSPTLGALAKYIESNLNRDKFVPIPITEAVGHYPLSSAQKRLFVMDQISPNNNTYNIMVGLELGDTPDIVKVEDSIKKIIMRHDSLRTSFKIIDGVPMQIVSDDFSFELEKYTILPSEKEKYIAQFDKPFDLTKAPLIKGMIINIPQDKKNYLFLNAHHIVVDGFSFGIIMKEFAEAYNGSQLKPVSLQYKDYSRWQEEQQKQEAVQKQINYWVEKIKNNTTVLNLPLDFPRSSVQSFEGEVLHFKIDSELTKKIDSFARDNEATTFMVLFSVLNILLHTYSGQEDIIIGTPIADRPHVDLQDMVGMFVNMMPLRNLPEKTKTYRELLLEVRQNSLDAFKNQDCQFDVLVEKLGIKGNTSGNPLFSVVFILQNIDLSEIKLGESVIMPRQIKNKTSKFDLTFELMQVNDSIECMIEYNTALFKESTVIRLAENFVNCTNEVLKAPDNKISDIEVLTEEEKRKVLYEFNDTQKDYSKDKLIHHYFIENADKNPEAPAVEIGNTTYTYGELNTFSTKIANTLIDIGITTAEPVSIFIERSFEMIAGVLGIVKSSCAYVPIEPYLPDDRVKTIWSTLKVRYVVTGEKELSRVLDMAETIPEISTIICLYNVLDAELLRKIKSGSKKVILLPEVLDKSIMLPENSAKPEDLAYIIFTSGSTGVPKGVMIQHIKAINLIEWVNNTFHISQSDKVLFVTSISFDLSVYDIFGVLSAGGVIHLVSREDLLEPARLVKTIVDKGITLWDSAPQALQQLVPHFDSTDTGTHKLKHVFLSGDWIPVQLPEKLKSTFPGVAVISLGGATEATIWSNFYPIEKVEQHWSSIPYGKPIQNAKYYILDANLMPVPIGVHGDLYIGGECLAQGYANDKDLTDSKFIPNPFVEGEKIYKTGDIARWFDDGNMEFLGRGDNQVKVRGFRIELGEIEAILLKYPGIKEAVVIAHGDKWEDKKLYGFFTSQGELSLTEIKNFMSSKLPNYFIPDHFIRLEKLPVTSNGKLDRKALIAMKDSNILISSVEYVAPKDSIQQTLAGIWQEILMVDSVGIHDNFFDIGGNSIKFIEAVNKMKNYLSVDVPVIKMFQSPTIDAISDILKRGKAEDNKEKENNEIKNAASTLMNKIKIMKRNS